MIDVKAAFTSAVRALSESEILEFSTWPLLNQFQAFRPTGEQMTVKPDSFIRVTEPTSTDETFEHVFYLEVDRSTESQGRLAARVACYSDHYRRGGLALRFGRPRSEFQLFPFRVLLVFRNSERRNNMAQELIVGRPPVLKQAWLTTFAEIKSDPLGPIWVRPIDYRDAVRATAYDVEAARDGQSYRRRPEREEHVEQTIPKWKLLCDGPS